MRRFRYHTGAPLRQVREDEPCPVLFRDLGLRATRLFLRGTLPRLAGPLSPITYMRTIDFVEPYTDFDCVGRLVFLDARAQTPWFSGVPEVYVAPLRPLADAASIAYVPGDIPLRQVHDAVAAGARDHATLREALGGRVHDARLREELARLDALQADCEETERRAQPLRRALQSSTDDRARARELLARFEIEEHDLCAAWNHVAPARRGALKAALEELSQRGHLATLRAGR